MGFVGLSRKVLAIVFLIALIAVAGVACTVPIEHAAAKVISISVDGITKTEYIACDELNISGATLIVTYDNGNHEVLPLTTEMLDKSSYDMDKPGEQKVRVVYGGQSTTFTINISEWKLTSVELASEPYVLDYVVGEEVDPTGAMIKCSFEGNKTKYFNVTSDMLEEYDNETVGEATVGLTYYGVKMEFTVSFTEKTPIGITIVDSAERNYVFVGQGNKYDVTGMTVRVSYDNDQSPKYDVKSELAEDVYISIDDSSARGLDAVLMYYPSDYQETYTYRFFGIPRVAEGETVTPGQELASNKIDRDGKEIVLDPIQSKSYGTVKSIQSNADGSRTMIISTLISYDLTDVQVEAGEIVANGGFIGRYGSEQVYVKGGGVVESIDNGVVTVKTAPTTVFVSNVIEKSFLSMEILTLPTPMNYTDTTVDNMIEGDVLDKSVGKVKVTYNDGSEAEFGMDDAMISLVNDGKESVNDTFELLPGRNKILVVYGGVMSNYTEFYATVESKYPVELVLDADTISGQTFYFGDTLSLAAMTYHVVYNNNTEGETEHMTADMVDEDYSLYCEPADKQYDTQIRFKLPDKYLDLFKNTESEEIEYTKPVCNYTVAPQPINSIAFIVKPLKVYVLAKDDINYENASLDIYYRNNERVTRNLSGENAVEIINVHLSGDWDEIESYDFTGESGERLYVFTRDSDSKGLAINDIIRKRTNGYEAKVIYFDEYNVKSSTSATFNYFLLEGDRTVSSIKVSTLKDADGKEYYQKTYTQYEDWNLAGLEITVTYSDGKTEILENVLPEMIYEGNTYRKGTDIAVKFAYLGATDDDTLKINVTDRIPTAITLVRKGKTDYVGRYGTRMDFSEYRFRLSYNSGADEQISGSMLSDIPNREVSSGWWYKMYNTRGEVVDNLIQPGTVVYELYYSYADENASNGKGYSYVRTMYYADVLSAIAADPTDEEASVFAIEVVENTSTVVSIKYEQNIEFEGQILNPTDGEALNSESDIPAIFPVGTVNELPVLAETAAGWEIMLSEYFGGSILDKVITVNCVDAEGVGYVDYVKITPSMLDYDTSDRTIGYRRVTIQYKNQTCQTYIYVWNAELSDVEVAVTPLQNYIYTAINSEEDLVLTGGIIRLTFTKYTRRGVEAGYMSKYINMDSDDMSYSGFVPNLYSKEGRQITITGIYKDYTSDEFKANYTITVYDRQDVEFSYSNVIFFYGNAADSSFTMKQSIAEFILPTDIKLTYIESKDMITIEDYLALGEETRKAYIPVTVYDEKQNYAPVMFIKAGKTEESDSENGDISESHFIDPAVGVYYVRYGNVYMIAEEDYALVGESDKGQFTALPTYDGKGKLIETFYITDKADIGGETLSGKILKYENVVTQKITQAEYDMLGETEKAGYEAINNTYYLMMRVTDDREAATRFYETANYAFQNYTIIQKVIEIRVEASNADAKVLKVRTKINAGAENGNPYAIYYLHNTALDILGKVKSEIEAEYAEATYINSIYLASPNEDYFEIVIKFNEGYVETEETKEVVAELYYRALKELTTNEFIEETGIELSHINFDFANGSSTYDFNANDKDGMKEKLKTMWTTGVNVFDKAEIDESIESGETPYNVSYTLTFGDMKTRNGVLQLLSGKLRIIKVTGEDGTEKYSVNTWTLGHDSYTIDLSKGTITEENGEIKIA